MDDITFQEIEAITKVLKKHFNNLSVEKLLQIAYELLTALEEGVDS